jgi:non-specific serine/threonine protein kinase
MAAPAAVPLTSFIGRDQEIASLVALLRRPEVRLLTLTGPGGIGKTRLAFQVANQLREQVAGGIAVVPLAPIHDPDLVLPTIAQILDVTDAGDSSLLDRVTAVLMEREQLLVLDNLEHLLDSVASLVAALLTRCPGLTVLTTSRVRLGLSGEQVVPVAPLGPETARRLFALRAAEADPAFSVTSENGSVIDAICDQLDRLPLALELAAARTTVLPPRALLVRLDQRFAVLTGGPRDAPDRQRDMRAAISWSYDLLPEPEQVLFRRLGVFVGGFTLDAAEAIAGDGADVLAGISALAATSLIIPVAGDGDDARFTMLETIHEYALERLVASGEEPTIRERHAHQVVALAESVWVLPAGPETETATRRLQPEIHNVRAALGWTLAHEPIAALQLAGALMEFWIFGGHVSLAESRGWVERALEAAPTAPALFRARALLTAGWLAMDQLDLAQADAYLAAAVAGARGVTDGKLLIRSLGISGVAAVKGGDLARARRLFEEQRTHALTGDRSLLAHTITGLGQVAMAMGDLADAQAWFEEALAVHQSASGPSGVALGHLYLGQVILARGDHARAVASFRESLLVSTGAGVLRLAVRAVEGLASAVATHHPAQAARLLGAAAAMRERDDVPRDQLEIPLHERAEALAQTALGDTAFMVAWEAGRHLSWDDILADIAALADAMTGDAAGASPVHPTHGLTPRETEVLRLLADGLSNRAISDALSISERTVENHVVHILAKLGLDSRTAAATWAVRHGLA